ncbi:MAG TPA: MmgE/PrpD family protein [Nitrospiraceae bacterium]|jgi:2-methylcitrate dehydratase|nr:MmgE/PrpD family protein [Nitrospiraceae bacterium]
MLADRLSRYCQSLCYDDLPSAVVHEVKRRILDSLGCALGAWTAVPCRIARRVGQAVNLTDGATLWGTNHKTLPDLATFANGTLVRYLDFNDTYLAKEPAHPSDNIAAILAVGEVSRASGQRVIQAVALAYEVQCRLCDAAALRPRGWDHVTYGPFSSTLAAAKVMKLSDAQTLQAINLAGVANIALRQTRVGDLSMWKACAFSNAARNGVFAALLAQRGMTGPSPIFEGEKGFLKLVSGPLELPHFGGEKGPLAPIPFKILETSIKQYPVEYHAQTAVAAARAIRAAMLKGEGVDALAGITDVEVGSYDVAIEIIGREPEKWRPHTRETADHSLPYCVAVTLLDGQVSRRSFEAQRLADPVLHALIKKVRVVPHPEFVGRYPQAMPTRLTVRTKAGKDYVQQVDYPLGHPKNRMADHEVEAKFRRLAAGKLDRARTKTVIDLVWRLEQLNDISTLMPLLTLTRRK